jgi:hypothetical protein
MARSGIQTPPEVICGTVPVLSKGKEGSPWAAHTPRHATAAGHVAPRSLPSHLTSHSPSLRCVVLALPSPASEPPHSPTTMAWPVLASTHPY